VFPTLGPTGQIYFRWQLNGKNGNSTNYDIVTDYFLVLPM
jgi:hypothetical protein